VSANKEQHHLPRFRFHVFNDDHTVDSEGKELPDSTLHALVPSRTHEG
jgi:hypothetical protein